MGQIDTGVGILESSVFLPNDLADIFDGEAVLGVVEGGV